MERARSFGERIGAVAAPTLQVQTIDYNTKVQLFNVLHDNLLHSDSFYNLTRGTTTFAIDNYKKVMRRIWCEALNENVLRFNQDQVKNRVNTVICESGASYHQVYTFIESILRPINSEVYQIDVLLEKLNTTLVNYHVGWRLTSSRQFVAVTNAAELGEIEKVLENAQRMDSISTIAMHLRTAISLLSAEDEGNLRLSVKEAISMVGVIARKISGENDLGKALYQLGKDNLITESLKNKFKQYYSFTNDKDGIRHELMEEPNLKIEEAKYFLIACSAFSNYLVEKAVKAKLL